MKSSRKPSSSTSTNSKKTSVAKRTTGLTEPTPALVSDLRQLIIHAREEVARAVDSRLVLLYWSIGHRTRTDILKEKRAEYGQKIMHAVSAKLVSEFGQGFTARNLANMTRFAEVFPDPQIVHALSGQLSWTHFRRIIYLDDPLQRDFYAEMCRIEKWNTRTLHLKIQSMLYERTALSKKPDKLIATELKKLQDEGKLTPEMVFRDPYVLDFLGLKDTYAEKDMEAAILREIERFILELGVGFAFVTRQKRMQIDGRDYYLDLLFYHRKLRRLVAIDLKIGEFEAADKGQMELYLNWLKRHENEPEEAAPMGMILCAGKSAEHVELLEVEKSGIDVASYWTETLPKGLLQKKLHQAVTIARASLEARKQEADEPQPNATATKAPKNTQKNAPTRQQGQFLAFLHQYIMRNYHNVAPTHADFQKFFNLTAPSVNSMLIRLEQRGFIKRIPGQARGIQLTIAPELIPPLERRFKF